MFWVIYVGTVGAGKQEESLFLHCLAGLGRCISTPKRLIVVLRLPETRSIPIGSTGFDFQSDEALS